jgi:hypothetical protein
MHEFRNVLIRLRAGDRDREVARPLCHDSCPVS